MTASDRGVKVDELAVENAGLAAKSETLIDPSGTPTLKVVGELDIASAAPIRAAIDTIVALQPERVVIDLTGLTFIDSSGLSLFLILAHGVAKVELHNPSPMVRKIIDVTGLSSLFVTTP